MKVFLRSIIINSGMVLAIAGSSPTSATTVNFTFVGTQVSSANATSTATPQTFTGFISFSYNSNSSNITLSDLTSFSAMASLTSGSAKWTFSSVNELSNFSYQNETNPFLSFATTSVPSRGGSPSTSSVLGSMASTSASLSDTGNNTIDLRNSSNDVLGLGSLVPAAEPSDYGLLAIGLIPLAIFGALRSRRSVRGR